MNTIRITKLFRFEMAHALNGYDGLCQNIHGHSYQLRVTVSGGVLKQDGHPKNGMVIDFTLLKEIVESKIVRWLDHGLTLDRTSPYLTQLSGIQPVGKINLVDYTPTCENLLLDIASLLRNNLPEGTRLHHLQLSETASSYAEWYEEDNLK